MSPACTALWRCSRAALALRRGPPAHARPASRQRARLSFPSNARLHGRPLSSVPAAVSQAAAEAETRQRQAVGDEGSAEEAPHVPVLLEEVLSHFSGCRLETYVDGTLGAGGHASALLRAHPEMRTLVGFDLDTTAHGIAAARLAGAGARVIHLGAPGSSSGSSSGDEHSSAAAAAAAAAAQRQQPAAYIVHSNFGRLREVLGGGVPPGAGSLLGGVDGILMDLGISSMQVDTSERGFSFLRDGPLDMRMDPGAALSAEQLINTWPVEELGRIIREFGEERHWRLIARRISAAREAAPITTTQQLVAAIGSLPGGGAGGSGKRGRGEPKQKHPATRTFQAIRIAVNGELASVAQAVPDAIDALAPGGRLAVITFHSLEDRIVKWAFRRAAGMAASDEPLPDYCLPPAELAAAVAARGGGDGSARRPGGHAARARASRQQARAAAAAQRLALEGDLEALPERVRILTRRPVGPSEGEERANPRARSAKLRVCEKLP